MNPERRRRAKHILEALKDKQEEVNQLLFETTESRINQPVSARHTIRGEGLLECAILLDICSDAIQGAMDALKTAMEVKL